MKNESAKPRNSLAMKGVAISSSETGIGCIPADHRLRKNAPQSPTWCVAKHTGTSWIRNQGRAIPILEKTVGSETSDVAMALNNLAAVYQDRHRYPEAERAYQRALATDERVLGKRHPAVANIINNLATLDLKLRKYAHAESLYLRALEIKEKAFGPEHPAVAMVLHN